MLWILSHPGSGCLVRDYAEGHKNWGLIEDERHGRIRPGDWFFLSEVLLSQVHITRLEKKGGLELYFLLNWHSMY